VSSRESRVTGQLTDGSRGSRVKKSDPLSSLAGINSVWEWLDAGSNSVIHSLDRRLVAQPGALNAASG